MDRAREAVLRAEVAAAEQRVARLKEAWAQFYESDPANKVRLDFIAQAIGESEDLLRAAEAAVQDFGSSS